MISNPKLVLCQGRLTSVFCFCFFGLAKNRNSSGFYLIGHLSPYLLQNNSLLYFETLSQEPYLPRYSRCGDTVPGLENECAGLENECAGLETVVLSTKNRNCSGFQPKQKNKKQKQRLVSPNIGLTLGEILFFTAPSL